MVEIMPESVASIQVFRAVTPEEVAHFREFGWVKLKAFINPDLIQVLLKMARECLGEDADSTQGISQPYFTVGFSGGMANPTIKALVERIGKAAQALMNRPGVGVRYFSDFFAPKLPAKKKTNNAGNGPTAFHQDFITFGVDRSGGMTF
jgi:hypothetical protein